MADDLNVALVLRLVDKATRPAQQAMKNLGDIGKRTQQQQDQLRKRAATETAAVTAMFGGLVASAIPLESKMADVRRVIDFQGETGLEDLRDDLVGLSTEIPKAATGFAEIAAAAGQAGVIDKTLPDAEKRAQIVAFAKDAARIGVAFELSAQKAADFMTTARNRLALPQDEVLGLADAVNHVTTALDASAREVADVVGRYGSTAQQAGFAAEEVAALAAAFNQNAQSPEVAATAMNAFLKPLTQGAAATKAQAEALQALGFDAVQLSERMQVNAKGAVLDLIASFQELDKAKRLSVLNQLFDGESSGVIGALVGNAKQLPKAFGLVADQTQFAGSALAEYKVQADTTEAALQRAKNSGVAMSVLLGTELLPALNAILDTLTPIVNSVGEWARQNPKLTRQLMGIAGVIFGLRVAMMALPIRFLVTSLTGLAGVLRSLAALAVANPLVLTLSAIAYAAVKIYQNWDGIAAWFMEKIDAIKAAFDTGLVNGVLKVITEFNGFTLWIEAVRGLIRVLDKDLGGLLSGIVERFMKIDLFAAGVKMIKTLFAGMRSIIAEQAADIRARLANIVPEPAQSAARSVGNFVDRGGAVGAVQRWWNSDDGQNAPGRALGGPVRAGMIYRWMENGQEMFVPRTDGSVLPAGQVEMLQGLFERAQSFVTGSSVTPVREAAPLKARGGAEGGRTVTMGAPVFNIHPTPGMTANDVARAIERRLEDLMDGSSALHDGGLYAT